MPSPPRLASVRPTLLALLVGACGGHSPAQPAEKEAAPALAADVAAAPEPVPSVTQPASEPPPAPVERPAAKPADPPAAASGGLAPLSPEQLASLRAGAEDPLTPTPIHYMKSNEVRHDVWFSTVAGKGGAYLGVGSDQNYTLAAAAGSELVFLADIDQSVVDLHHNYEVLIEASPDPASLLARFSPDNQEATIALLQAAHAGRSEADRKRLTRLYRNARETVRVHLERVITRTQDGAPTSWMSDRAMYDRVRLLFQQDRVRAMAGNLVGPHALQTAGAAARALGVPFRVVYFSNAEEYFMYTAQFIANVEALPVADDTVVLRTIYSKEWVHADQLWAYQIQPMSDFRQRLARRVSGRNSLLVRAAADGTLNKDTGVKGLSTIGMARP